MELTIIVILIVALVVVAIFVNAIQQHKERVESEKRAELSKQRAVIEETEDIILATANFPVSPALIYILHHRVLNALKIMQRLDPKAIDVRQRIKDVEIRINALDPEAPPPGDEQFRLPDSDKQIIVYIQAVKRLRSMLRAENAKGKVSAQIFHSEDQRLQRLQLKINVETLIRRGEGALASTMLGSARQYFEKAILALSSQSHADAYGEKRLQEVQEKLRSITEELKSANAADRKKKEDEEKDELDELFAPKKKW